MKIAITKNYLEKICYEEKLIAALNDKYQFFINENFIVLSQVGLSKSLYILYLYLLLLLYIYMYNIYTYNIYI